MLRQMILGTLTGMVLAAPAFAEVRLMMFDRAGCHWCAQWTEDVGAVYPLTREGRLAPLLRQDVRAPIPDGIRLTSPPQFTPTFVLISDGQEVGRIEGYPGEDFFWGLLGRMIKTLPEDQRQDPGA